MAHDVEYELSEDLQARISMQQDTLKVYHALPDSTRHIVDVALKVRDAIACNPKPPYPDKLYFPAYGVVWGLALPELVSMRASGMTVAEYHNAWADIVNYRKTVYTRDSAGYACINVYMQKKKYKYYDYDLIETEIYEEELRRLAHLAEPDMPQVVDRIDESGMIFMKNKHDCKKYLISEGDKLIIPVQKLTRLKGSTKWIRVR